MTPDEARAALAAAGGPPVAAGGSVRPLEGGWANWTFEVGGEWIVRFPRTDQVAASTARELALLPALEDRIPFRVPSPAWRGVHQGRPWFGYRRLPGRALDRLDLDRDASLAAELGRGLAALHAFPVERARALLGGGGERKAWPADHERLRARARARLGGVLASGDADRLDQALRALAAEAPTIAPVLVHRDLNPEHVLVAAAGRLVGIIDWEDAALADPAIDFAGFWRAFGPAEARRVLAAYGSSAGPAFERRVEAHAWMADVHDLLHAVESGDRRSGARTASALTRRLFAFTRE